MARTKGREIQIHDAKPQKYWVLNQNQQHKINERSLMACHTKLILSRKFESNMAHQVLDNSR